MPRCICTDREGINKESHIYIGEGDPVGVLQLVITGGNVNGHTAWKCQRKSLADIEVEESLERDEEN